MTAKAMFPKRPQSLIAKICRDETLRRRVAHRLRDEFAAIEHRMFSDIRVADADDTPDDPAPQPKPNQKEH